MTIIPSKLGAAPVLSLTGRLDTEAAPDFERHCLQEIDGAATSLILDLSSLDYLSSAGLRSILSTGKTLVSREGKLVLCIPKGEMRQIVQAVGFDRIFTLCTTLEEAGKHVTGTFKVHLRREWETDVMTVFGRVDAERAPEIEATGREILKTPYAKLLINMSDVLYLSSAGLCALLNLGKLAAEKHGRLLICSPSPQVKQILKLSGFDKILAIHDSLEEALVA